MIATGVRNYFSLRRRRPPSSTFLNFTGTDTNSASLVQIPFANERFLRVLPVLLLPLRPPPNWLNYPSETACVSFGSPTFYFIPPRPYPIHHSVNGLDRVLVSRNRWMLDPTLKLHRQLFFAASYTHAGQLLDDPGERRAIIDNTPLGCCSSAARTFTPWNRRPSTQIRPWSRMMSRILARVVERYVLGSVSVKGVGKGTDVVAVRQILEEGKAFELGTFLFHWYHI